MQRTRRLARSAALAAPLALALVLAAGAAPAEPWNPAKAAELAGEVSEAAQKLRMSLHRDVPPPIPGSGQQRELYDLQDRARLMRDEARVLHDRLVEGQDREKTRPIFRRLVSLSHDARRDVLRLALPQPATAAVGELHTSLEALSAYYPDVEVDVVDEEKSAAS